ncbi:hypothetical protein [Allocoleopsis sp.]
MSRIEHEWLGRSGIATANYQFLGADWAVDDELVNFDFNRAK